MWACGYIWKKWQEWVGQGRKDCDFFPELTINGRLNLGTFPFFWSVNPSQTNFTPPSWLELTVLKVHRPTVSWAGQARLCRAGGACNQCRRQLSPGGGWRAGSWLRASSTKGPVLGLHDENTNPFTLSGTQFWDRYIWLEKVAPLKFQIWYFLSTLQTQVLGFHEKHDYYKY